MIAPNEGGLRFPDELAMQICVSKCAQRYGPYSIEELNQQLESGVFEPKDFASYDDGRNWVPISSLPGVRSQAFTIEMDPTNNLLVIRYRGRVGAADVEQCAEEMRPMLGKLQPGFRLLADLTRLEVMDVSCAPQLENIMNLCNEKGVAAVARVIPDPRRDIGLQIMSYFHYGPNVRIVTCASVDEAMNALSE